MAGFLSGFDDPQGLDFAGSLMAGYGQQAGFAPAFGRALQAGGVAAQNAAQRRALDQDEAARLQKMQLGLLEYELANREYAAKALEKQRNTKDKGEVRGLFQSKELQELYDINPELAFSLDPRFADPSKRFVTVGNQVIDRLAEGGPGMAYEVEQKISPAEAERIRIAQGHLNLAQDKEAYDRQSGGSETTAAMRMRLAKIQDTMRLQGVDEATATAAVDNLYSLETDPISGRHTMVNRATGEAERVGAEPPPIPLIGATKGTEEKSVTVEQMAAETGIVPTVEDFFDRTLGQVPAWWAVSGDRVRAGQALDGLRQDAIAAFSLSGRPPVIEQERIERMLPQAEWMESPARAGASLNELGRKAIEIRDQHASMVNSGRLTPAQIEERMDKIYELERLATTVGALSQSAGQTQAAPQQQPQTQAAPQPSARAPQAPIRQRAQTMGLSWSDVEQTAREEGMSVEQVLDALAKAGVGGGG